MVVPAIIRRSETGTAMAVVVEKSYDNSNRAAARVDGGVYQAIASDYVDIAIEIPSGAESVVLYFVSSASDYSYVEGRVAFTNSSVVISGVTATNKKMGWQPPSPIQHVIPNNVTHLHVTAKAGNIVKGFFTTR